MISRLPLLPIWAKRLLAAGFDFVLIWFIVWLSFSLRLGEPVSLFGQWGALLFLAPLIATPACFYVGLYRIVVRHINLRVLRVIIQAITLSVIVWAAAALLLQFTDLPRSVILIYWFLACLTIAGSRLLVQALLRRRRGAAAAIYGADASGAQLALALHNDEQLRPTLFLDDNPDLQGRNVAGLYVHRPQEFAELQKKHDIREVLIAIPVKTRQERARLINSFSAYSVRVRVLPLLSEMVRGAVRLSDMQTVQADDLLGRDSVHVDCREPGEEIAEHTILLTGAGGSIGSELCRQICLLRPKRLLLLEHSEHALYNIMRRLTEMDSPPPESSLQAILGSVNDRTLLHRVIRDNKVRTIYHAAAYKHVSIVEDNVLAGIDNNVFGTMKAAQLAMREGVERFVLISSDKAVRPSGIMGASKRLAEMILQALAHTSPATCFSMVRFGNVLDSSGSVVPLFRELINQRRPLPVSHPDMTRYFMTIEEAAQLLIRAGLMAEGGEVFVLDMGEAVRIDDLARKMVRLSGLTIKDAEHPEGDIEIIYTGEKPGEKIHEELLIGNDAQPTAHPKILRCREVFLPWPQLEGRLQALRRRLASSDADEAKRLLLDIIRIDHQQPGIGHSA